MPKKKSNHFTVFVDEVLKPEKAALGIRVPISELYNEAFRRFEGLSQEEKAYYKAKAKESRPVNVTNEFFLEPKRPMEESLAFVATDLTAESKKIDIMEKEVHERIQKITSMDELKAKVFVFVSVQCFLETKPHIRPIEIAMVKWSMNEGIIDYFSQLVHPGEIPLGLRSSVKDFAEKTHQLTEDKYSLGSSDYHELWCHILDFISYKGVVEPVYSFQLRSSQLSSICLDWLGCQIHSDRCFQIRVDPVENLYKELLLKAGLDTEVGKLREFLSRHNFDLSESLRCSFHAQIHCEFCAMAFCKKPLYNMLNNLSGVYHFKLTEKHKQPSNVIVWTDRSDPDSIGMASCGDSFNDFEKMERKEKTTPKNPWTRSVDWENPWGTVRNKEENDVDDGDDINFRSHRSSDLPDEDLFPPLPPGRGSMGRWIQSSTNAGGSWNRIPPSLGRGRGRVLEDAKSQSDRSSAWRM